MLRMNAIATGKSYAIYLERDLAEAAYWEGQAAERLGIAGKEVRVEAFNDLQHGKHPETGEILRPRQQKDHLHDKKGEVIAHSRGCFDAVVSAPKSVSIMGLVDRDLIAAHKVALAYAKASMEAQAWTRVRRNGVELNQATANAAMVPWLHTTSRAGEIHIHTHVTLLNLTYDPKEDRWKALQAVGIYQRRHDITELYREVLARQVRGLGYEIELQPERSLKAFEIRGVSEELRNEFSRRSADRDVAIADWKADHPGEEPTPRNVLAMVRRNREDKQYLSLSQVREEHFERMGISDRDHILRLRDRAMSLSPKYPWLPTDLRAQFPPEEGQKPELRENKHLRASISDHVSPESGHHHDQWEYGGRGESYKRGRGMHV